MGVMVFKHSPKCPKSKDLPAKIPVGNFDDASYTGNKNHRDYSFLRIKLNFSGA